MGLDVDNDMLVIVEVTFGKGFFIFSHGQVVGVEFESDCRYVAVDEAYNVLGRVGVVLD